MPVRYLKYFLVFAMFMFVAKPFVGFSLRYQHYFRKTHHNSSSILVKSFTKRKLEHNEDSEFSLSGIQKRLANPAVPLVLLFAFVLSALLPSVLRSVKTATNSILAAIVYGLNPPQQLYLLSGKLTI